MQRSWRRLVGVLAMGLTALTLVAPAAQAGTANAGLPGAGTDPISGMVWGTPKDDDLWNAYQAASGANQTALGNIALRPRAVWLGWWWPTYQVRDEAALTVTQAQDGNPNALTEFATFELHPWESRMVDGSWRPVTNGSWNVSADEAWYRALADGIGNARALVIVQVDLPFARTPHSTAPERIDTYAAQLLSAKPRTTVYIDGGTYGWVTPAQDAALLISNGIRYARGFALNDTDYDPTSVEDRFGAQVVAALAKRGVTGKHFIVDTDENGQPYNPNQLHGRAINDAPMCHGLVQTVCQRTGIPPTADVASSLWNLGTAATKAAKQYCDGYVWSGRPWDIDGGGFSLQNAQSLAANGRY